MFTLVMNIVFAILYYLTLTEFASLFPTSPFTVGVYMFAYTQYLLSFWALTYVIIKQCDINLKLMLNLQYLDRCLHRNGKPEFYLLASCGFWIVIYASLILAKWSLDPIWTGTRCVLVAITITFDLELVYAAYKIHFLADKIELWTKLVKPYGEEHLHEDQGKQLLELYQKILDSFRLLHVSYRVIILSHFITTFLQSLLYMEILLLWTTHRTGQAYSSAVLVSHTAGVATWLGKGLLVETALCVCCDTLRRRRERVQQLMVALLGRTCCISMKRFAKNVVRLNSAKLGSMSACGVFRVDAALPLRLASVVATYTVVLLQFAFL